MLAEKENYLVAESGGEPQRVPGFAEDANAPLLPVRGFNLETMIGFCGVKRVTDEFGLMPDPT